MITNKLFKMQQGLDAHIQQKHGLEDVNLFDKKMLALIVELGELANETRCFKFWSNKAPSDRETILEEYVDGVHFILSVGIIKGYEKDTYEMLEEKEEDLTKQFLNVNASVMKFLKEQTLTAYEELFSSYIKLGNLLSFSEEEIFEAYVSKNEVNYLRQQQGY